jgi:DNA-binding MarR family transcriptional regulator
VKTVWELVSFAQGRVRRLCLEALSAGPKTPNSISESSGVHLSHVSRSLRELQSKGLVECVTPKATKNRIYIISNKGRKTLRMLRGVS